jgi:hypothetical protein
MDVLREFLEDLKRRGLAQGHLLGLLNVLIGRRLEKADRTLVANGMSWRDLAGLLKRARWDKAAVAELGVNAAELPPRDRQRYWYAAIVRARVDSPAAFAAGDRLVDQLQQVGYKVGPPPAPEA